MNKRDGRCSPAGCPPLGQLPCRRWKVLERGRSTDAQGEMTRVASELMPVMLLLLWALQPAVRACAHGKGRLETTTSRSLRPCTWWTWPGCSQLHSLTDALKCCLEDFKRPRGIRLCSLGWRQVVRPCAMAGGAAHARRRRITRQLSWPLEWAGIHHSKRLEKTVDKNKDTTGRPPSTEDLLASFCWTF